MILDASKLCDCIPCVLWREAMSEKRAQGWDLSQAPSHRMCSGCECVPCKAHFHPAKEIRQPWQPIRRAA